MSTNRSSVRIFQALGESTRLRIVALLAATNERACVCELSDALDERVYKISRHLSVLEDVGLLSRSRQGRWIYYTFAAARSPIGTALKPVLARVGDPEGQFTEDLQRFTVRLGLRENDRCVVWRIEPRLLGLARTKRGARVRRALHRPTSQVGR